MDEYALEQVYQEHPEIDTLFSKVSPLELNQVASCLCIEKWCFTIARVFPNHLMDIAARLISNEIDVYAPNDEEPSYRALVTNGMQKREIITHTLVRLLPTHPKLLPLIKTYLTKGPTFLDAFVFTRASVSPRERAILITAHRMLEFSSGDFLPLFNWSNCCKFCFHSQESIRWYGAHIASKVLNIPIVHQSSFFQQLRVNAESTCVAQQQAYQEQLENAILHCSQQEHQDQMNDDDMASSLNHQDHALLRHIYGITIPVIHSMSEVARRPELVHVQSTQSNLRQLALAYASGHPVLVEGLRGSGKSATIKELSALLGTTTVELHLDDQIDSKTLFGTYVCADLPGEFVWKAGALTQAMTEGKWVIIEDIDRVPFEVLASLRPVLEQREVTIAGMNQTLVAADGFRLFGTLSRSTGVSKLVDACANGLQRSMWTTVPIQALAELELSQVLATQNATLGEPLIRAMLESFTSLTKTSSMSANISQLLRRSGKSFSIRDLFKWCRRISLFRHTSMSSQGDEEQHLVQSVRLAVLAEGFDLFFSWIPDPESRLTLISELAQYWHISHEMIETQFFTLRPNVDQTTLTVHIGRVSLPRLLESHQRTSSLSCSTSPFAWTGHASRLIERLSAGVAVNEPILLVGETGCGKTTVIQQLAKALGQELRVQNLNVQTDSSDLLGGYKPIEMTLLAKTVYGEFLELFCQVFCASENAKFLNLLRLSFEKQNWKRMVKGMKKGWSRMTQTTRATKKIKLDHEPPTLPKRYQEFEQELEKFERQYAQAEKHFAFTFQEGSLVKAVREGAWILLDEINLASNETLERISSLLDGDQGTLALTERGDVENITRHPNFRLFAAMNPPTDYGKKQLPLSLRNRFTEIYVDELTDASDIQTIVSQFFNDIPSAPVSQLVDFYLEARARAESSLQDGTGRRPKYSLRTLCRALGSTRVLLLQSFGLPRSLYEGFVMHFATQLDERSFHDMEHYIKRTFAPILKPKDFKYSPPCPGGRKQKLEHVQVLSYWIPLGTLAPKDLALPDPETGKRQFVLTKAVDRNLRNVVRAIAIARYPILLQGPTSTGKTSLIQYIATRVGQKCVRINNHEHTDLQEYFGSYVSDVNGKLVFQEGILVEAVRKGWWVILDELNLAPSEVLEALNRLLDDNRELLIAETQERVHPHPQFMLFATQNPPGLYGGRKVLSQAFRNRFVELQVNEVSVEEMEMILNQRCALPPSFCKILVRIMKDLQLQRHQASIFAGKSGFITTRDLLRWATRAPMSKQELAEEGYFLLAERLRKPEEKLVVKATLEKHCGVTLNEREMYAARRHEGEEDNDRSSLYGTLDQFQKVLTSLNDRSSSESGSSAGLHHIAMTASLQRLFALVGRCIAHQEPVLLIGETGCGKTTVCQLYSVLLERQLQIVNCHQHTETSDLLGGLRPVRGKEQLQQQIEQTQVVIRHMLGLPLDDAWTWSISELRQHAACSEEILSELNKLERLEGKHRSLFEWQDGPLVESMEQGQLILLDEINLAEDAVLERLNSCLEPSRRLFLAEKGDGHDEEIVASSNWHLFATMNPGGDFGKRELSPALRNRFTEIWVPDLYTRDEFQAILSTRLPTKIEVKVRLEAFIPPVLDFIEASSTWISNSKKQAKVITLRDVLAWMDFLRQCGNSDGEENPWMFYLHGIEMSLLDGLAISSGQSSSYVTQLRTKAYAFLKSQIPAQVFETVTCATALTPSTDAFEITLTDSTFGLKPFYINRGVNAIPQNQQFTLQAPTTLGNMQRVLRAMQLSKPILLEGSPGVGKTSLISALGQMSGNEVVRINLSEQTDLSDLFGSDLPAASASSELQFQWCDGVFLRALKAGHWVLLDELNLASQSVLEGLNACFDHRGSIYIPEIGHTFECPASFRVFAAQNPLHQGGGRKGLPQSFLNRFTKVYVEQLTTRDYHAILSHQYPANPYLSQMIAFNDQLQHDVMVKRKYGSIGSPWEFNLRDIFRWCELIKSTGGPPLEIGPLSSGCQWNNVQHFMQLVYCQRMRNQHDQDRMMECFEQVFGLRTPETAPAIESKDETRLSSKPQPHFYLNEAMLCIGKASITRQRKCTLQQTPEPLPLCHGMLPCMEAILHCIERKWPCLLTGASGNGKTWCLRSLAQLSGNVLHEYPLSNHIDATELLGGFEQIDWEKPRKQFFLGLLELIQTLAQFYLVEHPLEHVFHQMYEFQWMLEKYQKQQQQSPLSPALLDSVVQTLDQLEKGQNFPVGQAWAVLRKQYQCLFCSNNGKEEKSSQQGFEWVDGPLVQAMERGDWIVLDNANFCHPSVLDRLNAVLEPNGELMINECGALDGKIRVIQPHANFRIFLTMDGQFGEISRAMRNRCVEIAVLPEYFQSQDGLQLIHFHGLSHPDIVQTMIGIHFYILAQPQMSHHRPTIRSLSNWTKFITNQIQQGIDIFAALSTGFERNYSICLWRDLPSHLITDGYNSTSEIEPQPWFPSICPNPFSNWNEHEQQVKCNGVLMEYHQLMGNNKASSSDLESMTTFSVPSKIQRMPFSYLVQQFFQRSRDWSWSQHQAWFHLVTSSLKPLEDEHHQQLIQYLDQAVFHSNVGNALASAWNEFELNLKQEMMDKNATTKENVLHQSFLLQVVQSFPIYSFSNASHFQVLWQCLKSFFPASCSVSRDKDTIVNLMQQFQLKCRWGIEWFGYHALESKYQHKKTSSSRHYQNFLEISFQMHETQNVHVEDPIVYFLVPFFQHFQTWMEEWEVSNISTPISKDDLQLRHDLYQDMVYLLHLVLRPIVTTSSSVTRFPWSQWFYFFIQFQRKIQTTSTGASALTKDAFQYVIERMNACFQDHFGHSQVTSPFSNLCWKNGGHCILFPFSQELWNECQAFDQQIQSYYPASRQSTTRRNWGSFLSFLEKLPLSFAWTCNLSLKKDWIYARGVLNCLGKDGLNAMSTCTTIYSKQQVHCEEQAQSLLFALPSIDEDEHDESYYEEKSSKRGKASWKEKHVWTDHPTQMTFEEEFLHYQMEPLNDQIVIQSQFEMLRHIMTCVTGEPTHLEIMRVIEHVQFFMSKACSVPNRSPYSFIPYQDLVWKLEAALDEPEQYTSILKQYLHGMFFSFHQHMWNVNIHDGAGNDEMDERSNAPMLSGLLGIVHPSFKLKWIFDQFHPFVQNSSLKLIDISWKQNQWKQMMHVLQGQIQNWKSFPNWSQDIKEMQLQWCYLTLSCFASTCSPTVFPASIDSLSKAEWIALLSTSTDPQLVQSLDSYLVPLLDLFVQEDACQDDQIFPYRRCGLIWIHLGLLRFQFLLPYSPVDPAFVSFWQLQMVERNLDQLEQWKEMEHVLESMHSAFVFETSAGIDKEDVLRYSQDHLEQHAMKLRSKAIERIGMDNPEEMFQQFFLALHRFHSNILSQEKMMSWVNRNPSEWNEAEVKIWIASCQQFQFTFQSQFASLYPDLVEPLLVALYQIQEGFSCLLHWIQEEKRASKQVPQHDSEEQILHTLLSFPKPYSSNDVVSRVANFAQRSLEKRHLTLHCLEFNFMEWEKNVAMTSSISDRSFDIFDKMVGKLLEYWKAWQQQCQDEKAEQEKLFQMKSKVETLEIESEEQVDEKEYRKLFPDYSLGGDENVNAMGETNDHTSPKDIQLLQKLIHQILPQVFQHCFVDSLAPTSDSRITEQNLYQKALECCTTMDSFSPSSGIFSVLPSFASREQVQIWRGLEFGCKMGQDRLSTVIGPKVTTAFNPFDTTSNDTQHQHHQLAHLIPVLSTFPAFIKKLRHLIEQWPENALLHRIFEWVANFQSLSIETTLPHMFHGVEQFLQCVNEWEENAAKKVSFEEEIRPFSKLVIEWRKVELQSWKQLLHHQCEKYQHQARASWIYLFDMLHSADRPDATPPSNTGKNWIFNKRSNQTELEVDGVKTESAASLISTQLFNALDDYLRQSNMGEFPTRCEMFQNLSLYFEHKNAGQYAKIVQNVLYHFVCYYYHQFHARWEVLHQQARRPVEKKIQQHVKLSSWDEQSYYSLAESSEKSHRKLFQFIKEYNQCLQLSMESTLQKWSLEIQPSLLTTAEAPASTMDWNKYHIMEEAGSDEDYMSRSGELSQKAIRFLSKSIPSFSVFTEQGLNECAELTETFSFRFQMIQNDDIPIQRKKKAFSDSLKELHAQHNISSLVQNLPSEQYQMQSIFELGIPVLSAMNTSNKDQCENVISIDEAQQWKEADGVFYQCCSRIGFLRQALVTSSSTSCPYPVSSVEKRKMNGLVENLFLFGLQQRTSLNELVESQMNLQQWIKNVSSTYSSASVCASSVTFQYYQRILHQLALSAPTPSWIQNQLQRFEKFSSKSSNSSDESSFIQQFEEELKATEWEDLVFSCSSGTEPESEHALSTLNLNPEHECEFNANQWIEQFLCRVQLFLKFFQRLSEKEQAGDYGIGSFHHCLIQCCQLMDWTSLFGTAFVPRSHSTQREKLLPLFQLCSDVSNHCFTQLLAYHHRFMSYYDLLLQMFQHLLQHGFGPPKDDGDDEDNEGSTLDDQDGTGMGQGEGKKDVSDEIEDEEQLLGLQDEKEDESKEKQPQDTETGVEMESEFQGDFHDLNDEEEQEEDHEKEDEEKEEELDREMGEFEPEDENVVDEKLWNEDEEDEENDDGDDSNPKEKEEEKFEKDSKVEGAEVEEDEIRTKDNSTEEENSPPATQEEKPQESKTEEEQDPSKEEEEDDTSTDPMEEDKINEDREDLYEENHNLLPETNEPEKQDEDQSPEDNELPENMQLDDGDDDKDDPMDEDPEENPEEDQTTNDPDSTDFPAETPAEEEEEEEENEAPSGVNGNADQEHQQLPEPVEVEADQSDEEEPNENPMDKDEEKKSESESPEVYGNVSHDGTDALTKDEKMEVPEQNEQESKDKDMTDGEDPEQEDIDDSSAKSNKPNGNDWDNQESNTEIKQSESYHPNPYSHPEETQRHWEHKQRQRNPIVNFDKEDQSEQAEENSEENQQEPEDMDTTNGSVEYADAQEEKSFQTLAPTEIESMKDMEDTEMDLDDETAAEFPPEEQQEEEEEEAKMDASDEKYDDEKEDHVNDLSNNRKSNSSTSKEDENQNESTEEPEEKSHKEEPVKPDSQTPRATLNLDPTQIDQERTNNDGQIGHDTSMMIDTEEEGHHEMNEEAEEQLIDRLRHEITQMVTKSGESGDKGHELWQKYELLTMESSQQLCEQLRLVLEPTLRDQLVGDYRTGKRINMRKVIPYLASQFRKDKIWMRRRKPAKRQYQIMIAIDDSESMTQNSAGTLALEALCTICKGLTQLQVGELSIVKFGEQVEVLHPFGQPFTNEVGAQVFSSFQFQQGQTDLIQTIQHISAVLEQSKVPSSLVEFTQLVFLISDARFDQHGRERIQHLLRVAAEKRQLVVLVVIDTNDEKKSLLSTKSVSFVNGKVVMEPYLDHFPFPYYLLLQNVTSLPETLSDALRQWFELLQQQ